MPLRRGDAPCLQQCMQIDLVGAAQDRLWIVDDHQSLVFGTACHAPGVMIQPGGFANEEPIEGGQPPLVAAGDQADVEAAFAAGANELLERATIAGRQAFLWIDQHRQVEAVAAPGSR